jgi:hypothetical protein
MKKISTGMKDEIGNEIFLGDRLWCMWGYDVIVKRDKHGYYGKLVCNPNHPCANMPYHLNNGKKHIKTFQLK